MPLQKWEMKSFSTAKEHRAYMACLCYYLLKRGYGNKQIARILGLGKSRVKGHIEHYERLQAKGASLQPHRIESDGEGSEPDFNSAPAAE